jgi:NAD(P)-dependent dehydrogenase (short-subunit alcohol dehydrogenase family)
MAKTIFITGASRGFGKIWAEAFLNRGDQVVATARNPEALNDLVKKYGKAILPLQLDVNDRKACFDAIKKASDHFGSIDVLINNAGYGVVGTIEEMTEKEARDQIDTNVFGLIWVTQAVLPIMRAQGHGHIIQVSSVLGITTLPVLGIYNASKFAVEGLSETLAAEVAGFGIKVTLIEPNGFATDWFGPSSVKTTPMKEYDKVRAGFQEGLSDDAFGVPGATATAVLKLVDESNPPLRLFLGKVALPWVKEVYSNKLSTWESWQDVAIEAHGK